MASISKCSGYDCPIRNTCYRFTSLSNEDWQSYIQPPGKWIGRKYTCKFFVDNKPLKSERWTVKKQ